MLYSWLLCNCFQISGIRPLGHTYHQVLGIIKSHIPGFHQYKDIGGTGFVKAKFLSETKNQVVPVHRTGHCEENLGSSAEKVARWLELIVRGQVGESLE